ncbi:MAG TPA: protein translocase subunit SecF [Candidatus Paceibacterota bacterium]|nr:protein translocase subunit SecF [Candidatus Paceibacterota bacterium]
MFIIKYRKIFIAVSSVLLAASIALIAIFGLKFGIEFRGGTQAEISYTGTRPEAEVLSDSIDKLEFGEVLIQPVGETDYSIKTRDLTETEHQALLKAVTVDGKYVSTEKSYTSIGPSIGKELKSKAITAIILVMAAIILFIAYAFRKVSRPVSSWRYGLIAIVTLLHDIAIPTGAFALISHFTGMEIDSLFIVALLTVLGLSVSDTIVVFDRIRENIRKLGSGDFAETVGQSLSQTFARSINTSLTVILVLLALFFFGPESTRTFSLVLTVGLFFGTYSSIFLASPLLVTIEKMQAKNSGKKKKK